MAALARMNAALTEAAQIENSFRESLCRKTVAAETAVSPQRWHACVATATTLRWGCIAV